MLHSALSPSSKAPSLRIFAHARNVECKELIGEKYCLAHLYAVGHYLVFRSFFLIFIWQQNKHVISYGLE